MKTKFKLLSLVLALCCAAAIIPTVAMATEVEGVWTDYAASAFAGGSVEYARDAVHKRVLRKAFRDVRLRRRSGNGHGVRALYAARRQSFADFYDASQYGAFHHGHDL